MICKVKGRKRITFLSLELSSLTTEELLPHLRKEVDKLRVGLLAQEFLKLVPLQSYGENLLLFFRTMLMVREKLLLWSMK